MDKLKGTFAQKLSVSNSILSLKPFAISFAMFFVAKYLEDVLQHIFKTVHKARTPTAFMVSSKNPHKRLLKARFLNIYWEKIHIEYYNFY